MADEKTNPTPKVARTDTMHSTPETPDRSKLSPAELQGEDRARGAIDPSSTPGRDGEKLVIKSQPIPTDPERYTGTLVVDIPSQEEVEGRTRREGDKQEEPELALQPGEQRGERGKSSSSSKSSTGKAKSSGSKSRSSKAKSGAKQTDTATGKTSVARPETQPDPGQPSASKP